MKKIIKLIKLMFLSGALLLVSCETTELDLTENPNALTPEQADPDFFLNAVQVNFAFWVESFGYTSSQLVRINYMNGRDYTNAYSPTNFDGRWRSAYQGMMLDIQKMNDLAVENGLDKHIAMGQFMQAYIIMTLVDFFGEVPYTEALQGVENLNPKADSGESIYLAAIDLLNLAIVKFGGDTGADPQIDFFYDSDWDQWIKAANTLKMKAYIATRLVDPSAVSNFMAILNSGDYIASNSDDLQFQWGTNEIQPDTRSPRYDASYTATGGGRYQAHWLMNEMLVSNDPRRFYYFYRQNEFTPGFGAPPDEEVLECSLFPPPPHYAGFPFCGLEEGYWGRDHGNDNGIPPDGFLRTLAGVYPAGGAFDDSSFEAKKDGDGNGGAGITPILLSSWTDFWLAEIKMVSGDEPGAKMAMLDGISKSVAKVTGFAVNEDPDEGDNIADHYDEMDAAFDAATDKMELISSQYFIASYGNGIDAYNFYRRVGYPKGLQPNIEPDPGGFIRSFFYSANYANNNSNATQKDGVDVQIYWDINPPSPGFPSAN
jgi:Starch-binding associating with outer membrane